VKKEWERQEDALAKRRNGRKTKGSGNGWVQRHDVHEREIMWEAKQTDAASYSIKLATWLELRKNATLAGQMPALALRIRGTNLVVMSQDDFDERWPATPDVPGPAAPTHGR
jgi:hypothetical protein